MKNSYEVIGNQIKFYLQNDQTQGWNQILHPQFRNIDEIQQWCGSSTNEMICQWDALHQNAMSQSEITDFLYRWISWYVKEPLDSTALEIRKLPDEFAAFITNVPFDTIDLIKRTSQMVLDCVCFAIDWIPQLFTILFF